MLSIACCFVGTEAWSILSEGLADDSSTLLAEWQENMPSFLVQHLTGWVSESALDFLKRILVINPKERPTAEQLLADPYLMNNEQET